MSLQDYTHIFTIGADCTPVKQLRVAASELNIPEGRIIGPFDWLVAPLLPVCEIFRRSLCGFFERKGARIVGTLGDHWRVVSSEGFLSIHHFGREAGSSEIGERAWQRFEASQDRRLAACKSALRNPDGNVLVVRLADARTADDTERVAELAHSLATFAQAKTTVAAISFDEPATVAHPNVRCFRVERSWPSDLPVDFVDWDFDYGFGPAWQGHSPSWSKVWRAV